MNNPKDYTKMQRDTWKKTVERYREDMLKLAKQNERFSKPQPPEQRPTPLPEPAPLPMPRPQPMPLPEPPVNPDLNGDAKLREEQELQKLFERTKEAREELERLEKEKEELEKLIEQQRTQMQPSLQPQTPREPKRNNAPMPRYGTTDGSTRYGSIADDVDYWSIENMRRLPNSIPIPERELPFNNSGVVLPPPDEGPGEEDNEIIDFEREPGEWETRTLQEEQTEDGFDEPAVFAQQDMTENNTEIIKENITEQNENPSTTPEGDRIIRPDYGKAQVDVPVEQHERIPTSMENTPRDRFDVSLLTGEADLIVQVFTARQALPVIGAVVTVSRITDLQGNREMMAVHTTDENGKTPSITLPTPPGYLSENPGNAHPYSEYTVDVKKNGYYENNVQGIQMFDGITTVEPVNLIPLPSGQNSGKEEFDISDYDL